MSALDTVFVYQSVFGTIRIEGDLLDAWNSAVKRKKANVRQIPYVDNRTASGRKYTQMLNARIDALKAGFYEGADA